VIAQALLLAVAVLAICVVNAFIAEADDAAALASVPKRFVRFYLVMLALVAFAAFGPF
jgi:hypothetical protein